MGSFPSKTLCRGSRVRGLNQEESFQMILSATPVSCSNLPQTQAQAEGGGQLTPTLCNTSQGWKVTVLTQGSPRQGRVPSPALVSLDYSYSSCTLQIKMGFFHTHYFIWSSHIPVTSFPPSAQHLQRCQRLLSPITLQPSHPLWMASLIFWRKTTYLREPAASVKVWPPLASVG